MNKRILIGLAGPIGSGKTTLAKELCATGLIREDQERYLFTRVRFAGPLKAMAKCIGLNENQVDGTEKETPCDLLGGMTPRRFMQLIGTEFGLQMICDDLWIRAWKAAVERLPDHIPIVCDDVRFANEAKAIADAGGILAYIARGLPDKKQDSHASEQSLLPSDCHIIIGNNGTFAELYEKIPMLIQMAKVTP